MGLSLAKRLTRDDLEAALRVRRLDHTVRGGVPEPASGDWAFAPCGVPSLDAHLGGGWPRGQLSEIAGPRSTGCAALLVASLAAATARGETTALVDPLDTFDPPSAAAAGIDLARLLWVRGEASAATRLAIAREWGVLYTAIERAIKAVGLILQAGNFGLVVLDLADVAPPVVARLPFTTWLRLERALEGTETVGLVAGNAPIARSARGFSVVLRGRPSHELLDRFAIFPKRAIAARLVHSRQAGGECAFEISGVTA